ncbi:hypothetical protein TRFO_39386 [Tritrichomonas foetus]|uniref:Uncharacterized protein n=1 Tax=Tritrichomonas foetus TaxID=1144522 RepID=A0A1J4J9U6_9EUKA|nr:hypothetical protein TRFO_39386 [Tritrichomonas foetus]|eukprot:OHS94419.1 hypothetical protein TRFO_39386 [Tritrichomonas foetus]
MFIKKRKETKMSENESFNLDSASVNAFFDMKTSPLSKKPNGIQASVKSSNFSNFLKSFNSNAFIGDSSSNLPANFPADFSGDFDEKGELESRVNAALRSRDNLERREKDLEKQISELNSAAQSTLRLLDEKKSQLIFENDELRDEYESRPGIEFLEDQSYILSDILEKVGEGNFFLRKSFLQNESFDDYENKTNSRISNISKSQANSPKNSLNEKTIKNIRHNNENSFNNVLNDSNNTLNYSNNVLNDSNNVSFTFSNNNNSINNDINSSIHSIHNDNLSSYRFGHARVGQIMNNYLMKLGILEKGEPASLLVERLKNFVDELSRSYDNGPPQPIVDNSGPQERALRRKIRLLKIASKSAFELSLNEIKMTSNYVNKLQNSIDDYFNSTNEKYPTEKEIEDEVIKEIINAGGDKGKLKKTDDSYFEYCDHKFKAFKKYGRFYGESSDEAIMPLNQIIKIFVIFSEN